MELAEAQYYNENGGDTEENRIFWEEYKEEQTEEFIDSVLHRCGYTVFNSVHLTLWEIASIISGWVELEKKLHGGK